MERREPHRKPFRRAEVHARAGQGPFEGVFESLSARAGITARARPTLAAILSLPRTAWRSKRNPSLRRTLVRSKALRSA